MAVTDAPKTTYSDTTLHRRGIDNAISMIDPKDTPIVNWLGINSANRKFDWAAEPTTQIIWSQDNLRTLTGTLSATAASDATALTVADGSIFVVGDVIENAAATEKMWVSAVDAAGNSITVTRAFGGVAATMATQALNIIGRARLEGATASFDPIESIATDYNYTQIYQAGVKVTRSQRRIAQYGITDELSYQADKKVPELMRFMEKQVFRGVRSAGSASAPRSAGGLDTFITTNTLSTAASSLVLANLESVILSAFQAGGMPSVMVTSPLRLQTLKNLAHTTNYLRIARDERALGGFVNVLENPWTDPIGIMASRHCPDSRIYFLDERYVGLYEFDGFFEQQLSITGDFASSEVIGEYSLVVKHNTAHGYLALT